MESKKGRRKKGNEGKERGSEKRRKKKERVSVSIMGEGVKKGRECANEGGKEGRSGYMHQEPGSVEGQGWRQGKREEGRCE